MYIIWSILNVVLYLYFLYLIVGYVSVGRSILPKDKLLKNSAAILLVIGVAQFFISVSKKEDQKVKHFTINERPKTIEQKNMGYYNVPSKYIVLEDNIPFNINANIRIIFVEGKYLALSNTSNLTGFISGFVWEQTNTPIVKFNNDGIGFYNIDGSLKWNLMGMNIYTESKTFEGSFKLDNYKKLEDYREYNFPTDQ